MAEKVVVFDFDGTLSPAKMPNLLADAAGVAPEMRALTERAVDDRIDYTETLHRRERFSRGLPAGEVERAFERADHAVGVDPSPAAEPSVDVVVSSVEDLETMLSEWDYLDREP